MISDRSDEAMAGQDADNRGRPVAPFMEARSACTTKASSIQVGSERTRSDAAAGEGPGRDTTSPAVCPTCGQITRAAVRRPGRPRLGEVRDKPWEALGISERTYYRRMKEVK